MVKRLTRDSFDVYKSLSNMGTFQFSPHFLRPNQIANVSDKKGRRKICFFRDCALRKRSGRCLYRKGKLSEIIQNNFWRDFGFDFDAARANWSEQFNQIIFNTSVKLAITWFTEFRVNGSNESIIRLITMSNMKHATYRCILEWS